MEEPVTSSDEEQESDDAGIFCNDLYSNSKDREGWIQCNRCRGQNMLASPFWTTLPYYETIKHVQRKENDSVEENLKMKTTCTSRELRIRKQSKNCRLPKNIPSIAVLCQHIMK
ncbi:hypothetical protein AVEN_136777-1 [Araneus ventricosus]|uniref:Uncharacterized protein n=1 Tax=Araneus ventricosus TaxID=182803 RepID=A0A4Y2SNX8_ARAVE|nr:hypothetical protein AVEN_136777-1 [Araneus ventricosus]